MPEQPRADFNGLVAGLASSALASMQETGGGEAGTETDAGVGGLVAARRLIDTLAVLQEKTQGNLSDDEARFLEQTLAGLKLAYVRASGPAPG